MEEVKTLFYELKESPYRNAEEREEYVVRRGDRVRLRDTSGRTYFYIVLDPDATCRFHTCTAGYMTAHGGIYKSDRTVTGYEVIYPESIMGRALLHTAEGEWFVIDDSVVRTEYQIRQVERGGK